MTTQNDPETRERMLNAAGEAISQAWEAAHTAQTNEWKAAASLHGRIEELRDALAIKEFPSEVSLRAITLKFTSPTSYETSKGLST